MKLFLADDFGRLAELCGRLLVLESAELHETVELEEDVDSDLFLSSLDFVIERDEMRPLSSSRAVPDSSLLANRSASAAVFL